MENAKTTQENKRLHGTLVGCDGNAFAVLGKFQRDARRAGWDEKHIKKVMSDAKSKDYTHLLGVIIEQYDMCDPDDDECGGIDSDESIFCYDVGKHTASGGRILLGAERRKAKSDRRVAMRDRRCRDLAQWAIFLPDDVAFEQQVVNRLFLYREDAFRYATDGIRNGFSGSGRRYKTVVVRAIVNRRCYHADGRIAAYRNIISGVRLSSPDACARVFGESPRYERRKCVNRRASDNDGNCGNVVEKTSAEAMVEIKAAYERGYSKKLGVGWRFFDNNLKVPLSVGGLVVWNGDKAAPIWAGDKLVGIMLSARMGNYCVIIGRNRYWNNGCQNDPKFWVRFARKAYQLRLPSRFAEAKKEFFEFANKEYAAPPIAKTCLGLDDECGGMGNSLSFQLCEDGVVDILWRNMTVGRIRKWLVNDKRRYRVEVLAVAPEWLVDYARLQEFYDSQSRMQAAVRAAERNRRPSERYADENCGNSSTEEMQSPSEKTPSENSEAPLEFNGGTVVSADKDDDGNRSLFLVIRSDNPIQFAAAVNTKIKSGYRIISSGVSGEGAYETEHGETAYNLSYINPLYWAFMVLLGVK